MNEFVRYILNKFKLVIVVGLGMFCVLGIGVIFGLGMFFVLIWVYNIVFVIDFFGELNLLMKVLLLLLEKFINIRV